MRKAFFRMTGMLSLAFLAATQTVRAQEPVLANIPFEFTAGNRTLPAGEYRVQKTALGSSMLLIQSTDQSAAVIVLSSAATENVSQTQSTLIFHRYGNRYFLSKVWVAGYAQGRELPKSKQEKEHVLARNETQDQVTIIARLIPPKP